MAYLDNVYAVVQIAPTGIPTYVRLSQNENGRILHFAISGDALPAGSTVVLTGTKPDGAVYSVSGTLANNVATFNEDGQLTAVAGEWDAKVEVTKSGNLIATGRIKFVIDADPSGGNIPSDSQLDGYIAEMLSLLDAGRAEAYGSPLVASTVAGMIDQSRVYVYTGSETGYTAGNWYYWNGSAWTSGGVYNSVAINTDTTLSVAGMAADAKATGDALNGLDTRLGAAEEDITELRGDLSDIEPLTEDIKTALLNCFDHVAWEDEHGQDYYDALYAAIYPDIVPASISAVFTQGSATIYDTDGLNILRQYLTVTATYKDGTTDTVTNYALSGTLTPGTSVITVAYETKTATFNVTVTHALIPDISTGEIVQGYYFNASNEEVASDINVINRTYFEVEPSVTYRWIQGFEGNTKSSSGWLGACCAYRILYYDANKTFISREVNSWNTTQWGYIEPRYYDFTTPSNAKYIRVSWQLLPAGRVVKTTPSILYAVTLVLAYLDDSTISNMADLYNRISIFRNGVDITSDVIWNGKTVSSDLISRYWRDAIFNVNTGGTPEEGTQNVSTTRIFNQKSFLLEAGDVIRFNNAKYGVRCEKISDGTLTHTSAWVTDNADYVVGGAD